MKPPDTILFSGADSGETGTCPGLLFDGQTLPAALMNLNMEN